MAWMTDMPNFDEARTNARRALNLPIGMASPLWLAFGAATTAGVAWWWMTRWARPLNIEAAAGAVEDKAEAVEAQIEVELQTADQIFADAPFDTGSGGRRGPDIARGPRRSHPPDRDRS